MNVCVLVYSEGFEGSEGKGTLKAKRRNTFAFVFSGYKNV